MEREQQSKGFEGAGEKLAKLERAEKSSSAETHVNFTKRKG